MFGALRLLCKVGHISCTSQFDRKELLETPGDLCEIKRARIFFSIISTFHLVGKLGKIINLGEFELRLYDKVCENWGNLLTKEAYVYRFKINDCDACSYWCLKVIYSLIYSLFLLGRH